MFRVQDKDGRGPWKPGFALKWVEYRDDLDNLQPWFVEFGDVRKLALTGMAMGSACMTVEQLRRWFTPNEYQTLLNLGYRAVTMEVSVLIQSDIQCVFQRSKPLSEDVEEFELYPSEQLAPINS